MTQNQIALRFASEGFSTGGKRLMGRHSAGQGFLRALAARSFDKIFCYSKSAAEADLLKERLAQSGAAATKVDWIPWLLHRRLGEAGLLYNPDPSIISMAWNRAQHDSRSYSLCGVVHTVLSHRANENLAQFAVAPLEPWDAVICTSRAVRDGIAQVLEVQQELFRHRLGAVRTVLPELPVIPLGVHAQDFVFTDADKAAARTSLGIDRDAIVVLFVGRLAYHAKAHPVPMYLALSEAARGRKVVLVQAGWFANDAIEALYQREMAELCKGVKYVVVDGRIPEKVRSAWAAADIFTSLSDNFQETFGLTPIEAMARGIPSVVSDWNGYRDTVRHEIDGFRIPSLTLPAGAAQSLTDMYDAEMASYDQFCASTSALVAIDVPATTRAYERLFADPGLRMQMGQAARQRAQQDFDWGVVMGRYAELWEELRRRREAQKQAGPAFSRPDRMNPFTMYRSYPSRILDLETTFDVTPGFLARSASLLELDSIKRSVAQLLKKDVLDAVLSCLAARPSVTFRELRRLFPEPAEELLARTMVMLCKVGIISFRAPVRKDN